MKINNYILPTLKGYKAKNITSDLISGIIIAAVSIPISMGYAQISGLPAVYGLFGSVFPILVFALFSTSPQFIFGVDAAPAALVGSALLALGIESGSPLAGRVVPVITFFVAIWLLLFRVIRAGKLVNYISEPVMGGFITGICCTIILMQFPKLMGAGPGTGEFIELIEHIIKSAPSLNTPSLVMGLVSLFLLLTLKKLFPKFPAAVALMIAGALMTVFLPVKDWGVATLSAVEPGLPSWNLPDFSSIEISKIITASLSISVVIMAETLLAENNFARKNGYKINDNTEIFAFFAGNLVAAFTGCPPINGSVSRTAMNEQYKGKTQLTSIVAGVVMIAVLLFATGFIQYLPVPVLTAIVISALIGATEFELAAKLWKISKKEFLIFIGAFVGVLFLGTINGVLIGILLSFAEMILRSSKPARYYIGIQPGHKHFRNLKDSSVIFPIKDVVIYKFTGSLFFANADIFADDIESAIKENTKAVIIDASAIGSIDITGANRLEQIYKSLKDKGIRFYMTEHIADLNNQMRALGLGYMIEEGVARRTIHIALKDMGINRPYPLEGVDNMEELTPSRRRTHNRMQELNWAFGNETEKIIEKQIRRKILQIDQNTVELDTIGWNYMDEMDEDEWLEHLEEHLYDIVKSSGKDKTVIASALEKYRNNIQQSIAENHPEMLDRFMQQRESLDTHMKEKHPDVYEIIMELRQSNK